MSSVPAFLIIILAAFAHASLQLDLGGLILLYHASRSKHTIVRSRILASSYIIGSAFMVLVLIAASTYFVSLLTSGNLTVDTLSIVVGILITLSLIVWFCYYRFDFSGAKSTELWVPRFVARHIDSRASSTSSRIEAFTLGMLAVFAEFPFSILLVILTGASLLSLSPTLAVIAISLYLLLTIFPLLVCRFTLSSGRTIVDIQRFRVKSRTFLRIMSGTFFAVLAAFIFVFCIMENI